jgi:hypothetical protein
LFVIPGNQTYRKYYQSCNDAFVSGLIHPEPGRPVTLLLQGNVTANCSIENLNKATRFELLTLELDSMKLKIFLTKNIFSHFCFLGF